MFKHRVDEDTPISVFLKWYILSFIAGNVNAGGLVAAGSFVSHVTGFATLFGVQIANRNWDQAIGILTVPAFFLTGAMTSAYLVDHQEHHGRRPHYDWVMLLVFMCLILVALLGGVRAFGVFNRSINLKEDYVLLALLCLASGLENAAITTASGGTVRATHMTGITTDLGVGLVRVLGSTRPRKRERQANWVRMGTLVSFIGGSVVGAILFVNVGYFGFLLPAALAFYAFIQARNENKTHHRKH